VFTLTFCLLLCSYFMYQPKLLILIRSEWFQQ